MQKILKNFVYKLENYKISSFNFIITLLSIAFIRSFCEGLMEKNRVIGHIVTTNYYDSLRHNLNFWSLEWLTMFATLVLIFYIFTKEKILKISKILLLFYPIIIIPVILDYFIYFPYGSDITYFYTTSEYLNALLNFFVFNIEIPNASLGVRIEVLIAVILSFIYIYLKNPNFFIAFLGAFSVYLISISSIAFPIFILLPLIFLHKNPDSFIFNFFSNTSFPFDSESKISIFIIFYLLFILFVLFIIYNKNLVINFLKTLISKHIIYFNVFIYLFGFFLAAKQKFFELKINIFNSSFTGFYIFSGIFLIFFISIFSLFLSDNKKDFKNLLKIDFYFYAVLFLCFFLSISISYPVFLITIFIFVLFFILFKSPFNLYKIFIIRILFYSILSCVFVLVGFAFIYGIYAPQKITFSLVAVLFWLFFSTHLLLNSQNNFLNIIALVLNMLFYLIAGIFAIDKIIILISAVFLGILTIFFTLINKKIINYYILMLFLLLFIIFI